MTEKAKAEALGFSTLLVEQLQKTDMKTREVERAGTDIRASRQNLTGQIR